MAGCGPVMSAYAENLSPIHLNAEMTRRAQDALLLGLAHAGTQWVAVGEHGVILISEDEGRHWRQVASPTSALLTAVSFADPMHGWAVGHEGVIIATRDGGQTWVLQHAAEGADTHKGSPLLSVHALSNQVVEAVGAYGYVLRSQDGGATWSGLDSALVNPDQLHLNAMTASAMDANSLFIAGEKGQIFHSADAGLTWTKLNSPTDASIFGISEPYPGALFVYGLGGQMYRSADEGLTWTVVSSGTTQGLNDIQGNRHKLVAVGNGGTVLVSDDGGQSFSHMTLPDRSALDAVQLDTQGNALAAGAEGIHHITLESKP